MKQEALTRNNLHRSSLYDQQLFLYLAGFSPLQRSSSLSSLQVPLSVIQPPFLTSSFSSFTHNILLPPPVTAMRTYSDHDFTREENSLSYPGGLTLIRVAPACEFRHQEIFCIIFNDQCLSLKFRVLLSSHRQNYLAISLPQELRI